mgnify:CR=1 FL=1
MSGLTRKKIAVLELIRTCSEGVTSAEVMYSLGMSRSTVFFILDSLLKDNLIFRAHSQRTAVFHVLVQNMIAFSDIKKTSPSTIVIPPLANELAATHQDQIGGPSDAINA